MRTIYLDSEYRCHVTDDGSMIAVETNYFDGKCDAFIEGYRFVPAGHTWVRGDSTVFYGVMVAPWKGCRELAAAQAQYEADQAQIQDMENALAILFGGVEE